MFAYHTSFYPSHITSLFTMAPLLERLGQRQMSTLVSISNDDIFNLEKHEVIKRLYSSRNPFRVKPVVVVADPFLFVHDDWLYLFYEKQRGLTGKGVITMIKTNDLKKWSKPATVLEEEFHLSFPNVFKIDGKIYMMPESGSDKTLRLYESNGDLTRWKRYKTLLSGSNYLDSSIIFHDNCYFLFTTEQVDRSYILKLYYSNSLSEEWIEHPSSPIAEGLDTGRNAGPVFKIDNTLYRPCQLTRNKYGEGLIIYEIEVMSRLEYKEKTIKKIIPNYLKYYSYGGHHINYVNFRNKNVVATDILEIKLNVLVMIKRVINKLIFFNRVKKSTLRELPK